MMAEANAGPEAGDESSLPLEILADLREAMIAHCRRDDPRPSGSSFSAVPRYVFSALLHFP
jgi:hypothetical protein